MSIKVKVAEPKDHKKIQYLSSKIIDVMNTEDCHPFDAASALASALSIYISSIEEIIGEDMLEQIIEGIRDASKKMKEMDGKKT